MTDEQNPQHNALETSMQRLLRTRGQVCGGVLPTGFAAILSNPEGVKAVPAVIALNALRNSSEWPLGSAVAKLAAASRALADPNSAMNKAARICQAAQAAQDNPTVDVAARVARVQDLARFTPPGFMPPRSTRRSATPAKPEPAPNRISTVFLSTQQWGVFNCILCGSEDSHDTALPIGLAVSGDKLCSECSRTYAPDKVMFYNLTGDGPASQGELI